MRESNIDEVKPVAGVCRCGALIEPVYCEAIPRLSLPGKWRITEDCQECANKAAEAQSAFEAKQAEKRLWEKSGLSNIHFSMGLDNYNFPENSALPAAVTDAIYGNKNLFLTGSTGTGKTHLAVAILRARIERTKTRGMFVSMPELMVRMRQAIKHHNDDDLLDEISGQHHLVLDDLGVERPTDYSLERLYMIIDRWYRAQKGGLVLTSNRPLGWIAEKLDDRLASRIAGMCDVFAIEGADKRLEKK